MVQRIAVIPGDGIGTEVATEGVKVLEACATRFDLPLDFTWFDYGAQKYLDEGVTLPPEAVDHFREHFQAIYVGALGDPRVPGNQHAKDILLGLRFKLDLYVNLRPNVLLHPELNPLRKATAEDLELVIFRENTEGLYVGMGGTFKQGTPDEIATNQMVCTRRGVERIMQAAFEYAADRGLRLCMSDKANVLTHAHGLWQRVFKEFQAKWPQVECRHMYADALAMALVRDPGAFDVIVTSNMFGDVLSDLAAELVGGLGVAPSANMHPGQIGLYEPVHGSAPDIAGQDKANPVAMILTGGLMLDALGHREAALAIRRAVTEAMATGQVTADLGGTLGTVACGDAISALIAQGL
ncbi:MAG: isocitrate/isopropylmalate dehydrogenase family protein [Bradymonadia bacterium]